MIVISSSGDSQSEDFSAICGGVSSRCRVEIFFFAGTKPNHCELLCVSLYFPLFLISINSFNFSFCFVLSHKNRGTLVADELCYVVGVGDIGSCGGWGHVSSVNCE